MKRYGAALLASIVAALLPYLAVAHLPFFSESYTLLSIALEFDGVLGAFDLALVPLRPLQYAYFYVLGAADLGPAAARAAAYAMHGASCFLVYVLARQLGCRRLGPWVALVLFAAFPSPKSLVWAAAISGPGRTLLMLGGFSCALAYFERKSALAGFGMLACFAVGLGFHQSVIVLPAFYVAAAWLRAPSPRTAGTVKSLANPWFGALVLAGAAYFVYVGFLREERYHGVVQGGSILANSVKATLALVPEVVRRLAVEGLRGQHGTEGYGLGAAVVLAALGAYLFALWKSPPTVRVLLLLIALDYVLPTVSTAFVLRYAYLSAGLLALCASVWLQQAESSSARTRVLVLATFGALVWGSDHVGDLREYRAAGALTERLLEQAAEVRAATPADKPVVLVDAPDAWGAEQDMPLFNWGLRLALDQRGAGGKYVYYRRYRGRTTTDHVLVEPGEVQGLLDRSQVPVLVYNEERREFDVHLPRRP